MGTEMKDYTNYHLYLIFRVILLYKLSEDEPQYIIQVSPDEQGKEQEHAYHLRAFHELVAGLAAGYNLVDEEQHMAAVQSGDGQNVHEGQDDGEEGRHVPELVPVPRGGENTADGSETSELLGSFLGERYFIWPT